MATESELLELLDRIADRAPTVQHTLERLALPAVTGPAAPARSRRWLPIAAAAAMVAASVIVSFAVGHDVHRRPAGTDLVVDQATYPLPLDGYYASATQRATLQRAQFTLVQRCATAHGVSVPTARIPDGNPASEFLGTVANDIRPLTIEQARTNGYYIYPSASSPIDAALAGLTTRQLEIVVGWNSGLGLPKPSGRFLLSGGCYGQATQTLLAGATPAPTPNIFTPDGQARQPGLFDDDMTVENDYLNQARTGETAPAMRQAQTRWSACMANHGYPGLPTTRFAIENIPHMQSASAKRQAVQDVYCKQSTGFMAVWVASTTTAQNAVIAAHRTRLAEFRSRLAIRMANAAQAQR